MNIPNYQQDPTGQTYLLQIALKSLGYDIAADNWRGPKTERALTMFAESIKPEPATDGDWHKVNASSFADPADVRAFDKCKMNGGTDAECFKVGDNGIGAWGHNTAQDEVPMVALPREIWKDAGKTGGAKVQLRYKGQVLDAILGDTMPSLANIRNGAGIDTNPAVHKAFGLHAPFMVEMEWRWA